jgi:hypothetical protein
MELAHAHALVAEGENNDTKTERTRISQARE